MPHRTTGLFVKDVDLGGLAPGGDRQSVVRGLGGFLWLGPRTVPHGPRVVAGLIELAALPGNTNRARILRLLGQAARNNRFEWRSDGLPVRRALRATAGAARVPRGSRPGGPARGPVPHV